MAAKDRGGANLAKGIDRILFAGLLLFLLALPFHLVIKKLVPEPAGTYWKEGLLGLLFLLWVARSWLGRRPLLTKTPLDWAVLAYLGLLLARYAIDGRWWYVGAWGLYIAVMYLPLFWLVSGTLRARPSRLVPLLASLVAVGALVAAGGLLEFVWNVPLWPSQEMTEAHGFPGVFIYGTNVRRVYFTFDSPTTLANTLAIVLPFGVVLALIARRATIRVAALGATALIAACIVVTFSRGIWVAALISLGVMAVWVTAARAPALGQRLWKAALAIGGVLAVVALLWAVVWLAWRAWEEPIHQGVVELASEEYDRLPLAGTVSSLQELDSEPEALVPQVWTLPDPISSEPDERTVLFQHPPQTGRNEVSFDVQVPENGALQFAIALSPDVWSPDQGDGVWFEVYVHESGNPWGRETIFSRYINPKDNLTDRRWRNYLVDLSPWAGRSVQLGLITEAGPAGDWAYDWAGWAEPALIALTPGYLDLAEREDAVLRHTGSIADWAQDETNRDRLSAWSRGIDAWMASPWWGAGLGSTGVAALRTRPGTALVPESQVLKALIELGPLGLLALAFLWFQIARVGLRTYRATRSPVDRLVLIGVLASLLVVFIEGWVYQNLEVKQVNAYFWTALGTLAFLAAPASHAHKSPETVSDSSLD
ncbi:MAG: O-antigen ligase family protein [Anaerolineae bacterium]|nr:O-antigen ligase family protein [Anaerolineae bacterium]